MGRDSHASAPHLRPGPQDDGYADEDDGAFTNPPLLLFVLSLASLAGCARERYRLQADRDVYGTIAKSSSDPRWDQPSFSIEQDPSQPLLRAGER